MPRNSGTSTTQHQHEVDDRGPALVPPAARHAAQLCTELSASRSIEPSWPPAMPQIAITSPAVITVISTQPGHVAALVAAGAGRQVEPDERQR